MIAIVKENGKLNYTHVYAEYGAGKKLMLLVENKEKSCLKWIKHYGKKMKRNCYILQKTPVEWLKKGKMTGEEWVINDKTLHPSIFKGAEREIKEEYSLSKEEYILQKINEIKNQMDKEALECLSFGFFGSYIQLLENKGNEFKIVLDTGKDLILELIFDGVQKHSDLEDVMIILSAELILGTNGVSLFVTEYISKSTGNTVYTEDDCFITADKLSYKAIF